MPLQQVMVRGISAGLAKTTLFQFVTTQTEHSKLYYVHLCMRGKDNIVQEALYKGTSKSAEGYAADIAFRNAHVDGIHVELHWQDGDPSSANSFYAYYPNKDKSKVILCGGYVARTFGNRLKELKSIVLCKSIVCILCTSYLISGYLNQLNCTCTRTVSVFSMLVFNNSMIKS